MTHGTRRLRPQPVPRDNRSPSRRLGTACSCSTEPARHADRLRRHVFPHRTVPHICCPGCSCLMSSRRHTLRNKACKPESYLNSYCFCTCLRPCIRPCRLRPARRGIRRLRLRNSRCRSCNYSAGSTRYNSDGGYIFSPYRTSWPCRNTRLCVYP